MTTAATTDTCTCGCDSKLESTEYGPVCTCECPEHEKPDTVAQHIYELRAQREAIDRLPEGYRTVFVMHDMEGYTHEEIGTALGVQPGTSKAQLFRARAKLREALSEFAGETAI